jgi:DNA topoisomerase II
MKITKFFEDDYNDYAIYDSFRSISNYIDGFKPSARKSIYTIKERNIKKPYKLAQLVSQIAADTQYIHGEQSLNGVVVGLAADYSGTNNINLIKPEGSFGNRTIQQASAARYIFTCKSDSFDVILNAGDDPNLIKQIFENEQIEPKYFVPILPLLLINGNEGIGNGFAQKILSRNPKEIIKQLYNYLDGKKVSYNSLTPYFKGFTGNIVRDEEAENWKIYGTFKKTTQTTILVTEVPVGYDLEKWKEILDKLEDNKVIQSYNDKSEDNKFETEIRVTREFMAQDDERILEKLKLIRKVSENFTCIDENNRIREFNSLQEIFDAYVTIRLDYYNKRKEYLINKLEKELNLLSNKVKFIYFVIKGEIVLNNKPKIEIENQCEKKKLDKIDDKYDYLLNMNLWSLTKEKLAELRQKLDEKNIELKSIVEITINEMWKKDLKELERILK